MVGGVNRTSAIDGSDRSLFERYENFPHGSEVSQSILDVTRVLPMAKSSSRELNMILVKGVTRTSPRPHAIPMYQEQNEYFSDHE